MEELTELFVVENKLNLAVSDINTLPTISITKVTHHSNIIYCTLPPLFGLCASVAAFPGS